MCDFILCFNKKSRLYKLMMMFSSDSGHFYKNLIFFLLSSSPVFVQLCRQLLVWFQSSSRPVQAQFQASCDPVMVQFRSRFTKSQFKFSPFLIQFNPFFVEFQSSSGPVKACSFCSILVQFKPTFSPLLVWLQSSLS